MIRGQKVTLPEGFHVSPERSCGGRRNLPYAFTEHGVAMLSVVLASERAVKMSVLIIRAFVRMRELIANHKELAMRVEKIEDAGRAEFSDHDTRGRDQRPEGDPSAGAQTPDRLPTAGMTPCYI